MILNPILKKTVVNSVEPESVAVELDMKGGDMVIVPQGEKTLIDKATVKKPPTMLPENIRSGVDIGGVIGEYETPIEELSVVKNGEYTPPAGKHFSKVNVNVPADSSGVILPSVSNPASSAEVLEGRGAIDANGNAFTGSMPNNGAISETMDGINVKSVAIPAGYTSGGTVSLTDDIDNEVDTQAGLIAEIKAVLEAKASGSGESDDGTHSLTIYATASNGYYLPVTWQIGVSVNGADAEYYSVTCEAEEYYDEEAGDYLYGSSTVEVCNIPTVSATDTVTVYFTNAWASSGYLPNAYGSGCTIDEDFADYGSDEDIHPYESCTVTVTNVTSDANVTIEIPAEA